MYLAYFCKQRKGIFCNCVQALSLLLQSDKGAELSKTIKFLQVLWKQPVSWGRPVGAPAWRPSRGWAKILLDTVKSARETVWVSALKKISGWCVQLITGARSGEKQASLVLQMMRLLLNSTVLEPSYGFSTNAGNILCHPLPCWLVSACGINWPSEGILESCSWPHPVSLFPLAACWSY